jgi:prepilin-type N-terminal cleavage/methylation domain-containing protein
MKIKKNRGFTLIELIVVIAILAILSFIAIPSISGYIKEAKMSADKATLRTLNNVTTMYKVQKSEFNEDVFIGLIEDENRIKKLVDERYLQKEVSPQQSDATFQWEISKQVWQIYVNNVPVQLSPLGNNFNEISAGMISTIIERYNEEGNYGRTWGDYRYTDVDLDPDDWKDFIVHLNYTPSGSKLLITPENGYTINIKNNQGETKTVYFGYNLIYDTQKEKWFYHSDKPENEVDIDTLELIN